MSTWIESLVRARWLVASLGETATPPWWRSQATTAGLRTLERLFPRTATTAALETAGRAAAIEHDARIGRTGVYHLFRLPVADEVAVRAWLGQTTGHEVVRRLAALGSVDERRDALQALAGTEPAPGSEGPVNCGPVTGLRSGPGLRRVCAAYVRAHTDGRVVYPFLEESPS